MRLAHAAAVAALLAALTPGVALAQPSASAFADDYKSFLHAARTPYEVVEATAALSEGRGFVRADPSRPEGLGAVEAGDRLLFVNRGLTAVLVVVGEEPLEAGVRMVVAHADVPSLMVTPRPVTSRGGVAWLTARRYGGLKRYHYQGVPLSLRGVVHKRGGEVVRVNLGPEEGFAFMVQDLDTSAPVVDKPPRSGGPYAILAASAGEARGARDPAKLSLLEALHARYGIVEADLDAAQLYAVPAWPVRDVGLGRGAIGGFGHDDRACSYAALRALLDGPAGEAPEHTAVVVLVDREEIGSTGPTGMRSEYLRMALGALMEARGGASEMKLRRAMRSTRVLSSDVTAAINPIFEEVQEVQNAPTFGRGPAMMKFTGHGGKQGGSEASAAYIREVVDTFAAAGVPLQTSEIGRVDEGGGGTIAKYLAHQGADVLDVGVALLSMHAPFELVHKRDLAQLYRGFSAFLWSAPRPTPPPGRGR